MSRGTKIGTWILGLVVFVFGMILPNFIPPRGPKFRHCTWTICDETARSCGTFSGYLTSDEADHLLEQSKQLEENTAFHAQCE